MKIFYQEDNQSIRFYQKDKKLKFTVRDFDVHETIVVEWAK